MDKRLKILNIILIINIIIFISIFIYFYMSNMGAAGYKVEINNIVLFFPIVDIGLLIINKIKKINYKSKLLLICIFIIISMICPIYQRETFYIPKGEDSYLMGIAKKTEKFNVYGIKIFEKK